MSSSVFIESNATPQGDGVSANNPTADSDLVVIYGKSGVSFDQKGLENLIEEKTVSSISVLRLTSPTPSMEDEESEAEKLEEELKKEENASSAESDEDSEDSDSSDEESKEKNDSEEDSENVLSHSDEESSRESTKVKVRKGRKNLNNKQKDKRIKPKAKKEKPEVVGLKLEEFYTGQDAKELLRSAFKMAGVPPVKKTAEHEFMLYVIQNDHNYTPFTSPEQMKAKLEADKCEAEKVQQRMRRISTHTPIKYNLAKKPPQQKLITQASTKPETARIIGPVTNQREGNEDESPKDLDKEADKAEAKIDIKDDENPSTDNDRDSDADFNLTNRKKKTQRLIKRVVRAPVTKQVLLKKPEVVNVVAPIEKPKVQQPVRVISVVNIDNPVKPVVVKKLPEVTTAKMVTSPQIVSLAKAPAPTENKIFKQTSLNLNASVSAKVISVQQVGSVTPTTSRSTIVQLSPQAVKQIDLNKVKSSPKGVFTNIDTLLEENKEEKKIIEMPTTPKTSGIVAPLQITPSKGFTPLVMEAAVNKQLPSQISVQTHQSSSEIAAENEKQMDLIDSLVQDVMKDDDSLISEVGAQNKNIPDLVKMLESTEKALEKQDSGVSDQFNLPEHTTIIRKSVPETTVVFPMKARSALASSLPENTTLPVTTVVPVNNATLPVNTVLPVSTALPVPTALPLNSEVPPANSDLPSTNFASTPSDDLPEELLQHVVNLIEKDESLKEAVEKQVFGNEPTETKVKSSSPPPLAPITPQKIQKIPPIIQTSTPKSIIQVMTSNDTPSKQTSTPLGKPQPQPQIRSEPIQIVRGNGRVITLPPIEAPTTRAKRRAQVEPTPAQKRTAAVMNESELDISNKSTASVHSDSGEKEPEKKVGNRSRRSSKETAATGKGKRQATGGRRSKRAQANKSRQEIDTEDSEAQDDDDPNKLWCICRQPHNNRFMICCDSCEEWFHGTCVNVTKAMGTAMEHKKIEWICPNCIQKQEEKKQLKITDMLTAKTPIAAPLPPPSEPIFMPATTSTPAPIVAPPREIRIEAAIKTEIPVKEIVPPQVEPVRVETPKPKKPLIEIKSVVKGQFVSLADLEQLKKTPSQASRILSNAQNSIVNNTLNAISPSTPTMKTTSIGGNQSVSQKTLNRSDSSNKATHHSHIKVQKAINFSTLMRAEEPAVKCVQCKKGAKENSVYCSDECINKYVRNVIHQVQNAKSENTMHPEEKKKKVKGLFEDLLSMADKKPKIEKLSVIERKTGRILVGHCAPSVPLLKRWLQENPTFEVIFPGSQEALDIEKKHKQKLHQTTITTSASSTNIQLQQKAPASPTTPNTSAATTSSPSFVKLDTPINKPSQPSTPPVHSTTSKKVAKNSQQTKIKAETKPKKASSSKEEDSKPKEKSSNKESSSSGKSSSRKSSSSTQPIRTTVRRTIKEQLMARIKSYNEELNNPQDPNVSDESKSHEIDKKDLENFTAEVEDFVKSVETEMYNFFRKDTGAKYRAKYRSLMFNIKDRKNQTLLKKICCKLIDAKQLVRLSPEELASQELAQWRQNETKHQLEIIKKSELESLSSNRNYVLKTHKGEEVIEEKAAESVNLDMTIPIDQVVSMLNNETAADSNLNTSTEMKRKKSLSLDQDSFYSTPAAAIPIVESSTKTSLPSEIEDESSHSKVLKKDSDTAEHQHEKSKHKSKDHGRGKQKSHKRSRSTSRSRSRSRSREKRHKSSSKDQHKEKEQRRSSSDKEKTKHHVETKEVERKDKKAIPTAAAHSTTSKEVLNVSVKEKPNQVKKSQKPKTLDAFNLVDKILESTKTVEEAANLVTEKESASHKDSLTTPSSQKLISEKFHSDSDQEPSSTVCIATPPQDPYVRYYGPESPVNDDSFGNIWSGSIHMIEVTSFQTTIQKLSANSLHLIHTMPKALEVVGRIGPDTVWDYVSKIKKSPHKEIVLVRLIPSSESDTPSYVELFQYLENRNRLGVIKPTPNQIRDFYIYPLGVNKEMPSILQPLENEEFYTDPYRPDILIGILIRVLSKRPAATPLQVPTPHTSVKYPRKADEAETNSPPASPKRRKWTNSTYLKEDDEIDIDAIIKAPIVAKSQKKAAAAAAVAATPTSKSASNDADEPYSPGGSSSDGNSNSVPATTKPPANIKDDDLNRKMEELNRQIAVQEMEIAGLLNVEHSSNVLANISIPPDLSQILASIQPKSSNTNTTASTRQKKSRRSSNAPVASSSTANVPRKQDVDEEYDPEKIYQDEAKGSNKQPASSSSRLAQLTEAELLSMVPDDILVSSNTKQQSSEEPPPPGV